MPAHLYRDAAHHRLPRRRDAQERGLGFTNATDLADYLVGKGVPFRDAHHVSGALVGKCVREGRALSDLSLEELQKAVPKNTAQAVYEHYHAKEKED